MYQWAMITALKDNDPKDIAVGDMTKAMLATVRAKKQEVFVKNSLRQC